MKSSGSCLVVLIVAAMNLCFGALSLNYVLDSFIGKQVPFVVAFVGGLLIGPATITVAVFCWFLRACGVHVPFLQGV